MAEWTGWGRMMATNEPGTLTIGVLGRMLAATPVGDYGEHESVLLAALLGNTEVRLRKYKSGSIGILTRGAGYDRCWQSSPSASDLGWLTRLVSRMRAEGWSLRLDAPQAPSLGDRWVATWSPMWASAMPESRTARWPMIAVTFAAADALGWPIDDMMDTGLLERRAVQREEVEARRRGRPPVTRSWVRP